MSGRPRAQPPKGAAGAEFLTASLKRRPDTDLEFLLSAREDDLRLGGDLGGDKLAEDLDYHSKPYCGTWGIMARWRAIPVYGQTSSAPFASSLFYIYKI
jgi:hypothetical protein